MTSRFFVSLSQTAVSPAHRKVGRVRALAVTALLAIGTAAPLTAQVTFEEVEAALSALEAQAGGSAHDIELAPPPSGSESLDNNDGTTALHASDYDFLPALEDDLPCNLRASEIAAYSAELQNERDAYGRQIENFTSRFVVLQEQQTQLQIERAFSCPDDYQADLTTFRNDVEAVGFEEVITQAETNLACFQENLRELESQINELGASSDPNAANSQLILSGLLERSAAEDSQLTTTLDNIIFFERRRLQLLESSETFLGNCELMEAN